jgi:hypothetical protein
MVEELLRALRELPGLSGPLRPRILDDGDAVAAWEGDRLAAVLFPTGEALGEVRRIAEARPDGLVLLVNPQWSESGNVVSDLGFLPWQRAANERLVASFAEAYALRQLRINSDDVRLLYAHPGPWQVNLTRPDTPSQVGPGGGRGVPAAGRGRQAKRARCTACLVRCPSYPHLWCQQPRHPSGPMLAMPPPPHPPTHPRTSSQSECVARREQRPSYRDLEGVLRGTPWSMSAKPLGERLRYEAQWVRRSLDPPPPPQG